MQSPLVDHELNLESMESAMNTTHKTPNVSRHRAVSLPALACLALALGSVANASAAQTTQETQWVPGRLLVQPRPGLSDAEFDKILKPHGAKQVAKIDAINVRVVQLPPKASEKAIAALLSKNKHLKFAERDPILKASATANDRYFPNAWHLAKTGAPTAWDQSTGRDVVIAILDTGIDGSHPDLAGKLVSGWNFYDNNSNTSDVHGHGTAVGGAAVALTNNSIGVAAVAPDAFLMPVRIADPTANATGSMIAQGLSWAADNGADVANISYAGVPGNSTIQAAAQYMKSKGGVVVVAAGNNGIEESVAPHSSMVAVSATDASDVKTSWSSYGSYVDVAAPGVTIYSTGKGGVYGTYAGTSLASPVVAGVVALIKAANPSLPPDDVERVLFSSATDLGAAGFDKLYGNGRVNAAAAVQTALVAKPSDFTAPSVSFATPSSGSTVKGLVSVSVSASDNVGVSKVELRANGKVVGTDITAPYGFSWDSTTASDGNATLTAYAYDAAGNYSSATATVTIANSSSNLQTDGGTDTTPPLASISNPSPGSKVNGNVPVSASATDNVGVSKITLFIDGRQVATGKDSLTYKWNTRSASAGTHTLRVDAIDLTGNLASTSVQVFK